jgi:hypothetical protein
MSIYVHYVQSIIENLELSREQLFFKSDPRYQYVLEHVSKNHGSEYLDLIKEEFHNVYKEHKNLFVNLSKKNDSVGKPTQYYYFDFCECSPTNLRYIYQSLLILKYANELGLKTLDIIEIGGGYGGLCFFLKNMCHIYSVNIASYVIYDLPEAESLQSKYLEYHDLRLSEKQTLKGEHFLISNYAFSELPEPIRKTYEKEVINPFCSFGFLAWNGCEFYRFVDDKDFLIEEEKPQTHPNNRYIYFK